MKTKTLTVALVATLIILASCEVVAAKATNSTPAEIMPPVPPTVSVSKKVTKQTVSKADSPTTVTINSDSSSEVKSLVTGPLQVDIYFTVAPIQGSVGFAAWQANFIATMQYTSHPSVPIIYPGAVISATNLFSFYPGNIGNELLAGAHVRMNGSTFSLNQITWIWLSPIWGAFTNVSTGLSFGPGIMGSNGGTLYTSGLADNVPLTDLWMTPEGYSYLVGQGRTIDQAVISFINSFGLNVPITLSCVLNGTTNYATITAQAQPTLTVSYQVGNDKMTMSWPNFSAYPFVLEQNSDLDTTNWSTTITGKVQVQSPAVVGAPNVVTVTNTGSNMFYRLRYN